MSFDVLVKERDTVAVEEKSRSEETLSRLQKDQVFTEFSGLAEIVDQIQASLYSEGKKVSVRVARLPGENAFALPDGTVVIHLSLLATLESIEQLAFVLAHEIAHIELNHGYIGAAHRRTQRISAHVSDVLTLGMRDSYHRYVARVNSQIRGQEYAADRRAAEVLQQAGYSLKPAIGFFRVLDDYPSFSTRIDEASTHPSNSSRIKRLAGYESEVRQSENDKLRNSYRSVRQDILKASVIDKIKDVDYISALIQLRELIALTGENEFSLCATAEVYHSMSLINSGYYSDQLDRYLGVSSRLERPIVYESNARSRFLQKAHQIYRSVLDTSKTSACGLRGIGLVSFTQQNYVEARVYLESYLKLSTEIEDRRFIQAMLEKKEMTLQ